MNPHALLKQDVSPHSVEAFIEEYLKHYFKIPPREAEEGSEDHEERVEAASAMAGIKVAGQVSEVAQQVFVKRMVKLFELGYHLYVKDVANISETAQQLEGLLDVLLPGQVSKHVRSKLRTIVTELMPRLVEANVALSDEIIEALGTNSDEVGAPHNMYAAAVGLERAEKQKVLDRDLVKEVAEALNKKVNEHEIRKIFEDKGVQFETKRTLVYADARMEVLEGEISIRVSAPEGVDATLFREELWSALNGASVNMKRPGTDKDGKPRAEPIRVELAIAY